VHIADKRKDQKQQYPDIKFVVFKCQKNLFILKVSIFVLKPKN